MPNLKIVNILLFKNFLILSIRILISLYESISPLEVDLIEAAAHPHSLFHCHEKSERRICDLNYAS